MKELNIVAPKNEILWVQYYVEGMPRYVITSTKLRDQYFLYDVLDGKLHKTKYKDNDPKQLEQFMTAYNIDALSSDNILGDAV